MMLSRLFPLLIPCLLGACSGADVLNAITPSGGVTQTPDIAYGDHPRQVYDLYTPESPADDAPLVIYVHGGSWDSGDKSIYPFIGNTLARHGAIVAVPNYRLAPEVIFPAFVDDIALAFAKLRTAHPERDIYMMGHSAGAQIAGLVTVDERYLAVHGLVPSEEIKGFLSIAGPFDFLPLQEQRYKDIFPEPVRDDSQAVNFVVGNHPPILLLHGTTDETVIPRNSLRFEARLKEAGSPVELKLYGGKSHIDIIIAISPALSWLGETQKDTLRFLGLQ